MTENTAGTPAQDPAGIAERIARNAAAHGADLEEPLTMAGFFASAAAVLAHAARALPEAERRAHAQAMLELVDAVAALAVQEQQFADGWDAFLAVHASMVKRAVEAGALSEQTQAALFDASARLLRES